MKMWNCSRCEEEMAPQDCLPAEEVGSHLCDECRDMDERYGARPWVRAGKERDDE